MNPALLIANLAAIEQIVRQSGSADAQTLVLEAQDCILGMQREILDLRIENQALRRMHKAETCEMNGSIGAAVAAAPIAYHRMVAGRRRSFLESAEKMVTAAAPLARAV